MCSVPFVCAPRLGAEAGGRLRALCYAGVDDDGAGCRTLSVACACVVWCVLCGEGGRGCFLNSRHHRGVRCPQVPGADTTAFLLFREGIGT